MASIDTKSALLPSEIEALICEKLRELSLTQDEIAKVLKKFPLDYVSKQYSLKPDSNYFRFKEKIENIVEIFAKDGLTFEKYVHAALDRPSLFYLSPSTIETKINCIVERFKDVGLTRAAWVQTSLKNQSLFHQSPNTIEANINGVVERFKDSGLTRPIYFQAALNNTPDIFMR